MIERPEILELFACQHGVAKKAQLVARGASSASIGRAANRGGLVVLAPGLYRLAGQQMTFKTRATAALLLCGPNAFLDGASAGAVRGLRSMPTGQVRVTTRGRVTVAIPAWVVAASTSWVLPGDVVIVDGFTIASPCRMLLAMAASFNWHRFERAAEDAWHLRLVSPTAAAAYLDLVRGQGRSGVAVFERWVSMSLPRRRAAQSGLEMDALDAVRLAGLPEPVRQHPLRLLSGELIHLDLAWPDVRMAVEPGHSWWHGGNERTAADYARDRQCGEIGWHVTRFEEAMSKDLVGAGKQIRNIYESRQVLRS